MRTKQTLKCAAVLLYSVLSNVTAFAQTTPPPKQWDKRYGGNSADDLYALQQTNDGGYIYGGSSWSDSSGDKTENSRGNYDFWVVKTDAHGNKQWDKRFGGTNVEELRSVQQTIDGGYILGGKSLSGLGGDKTENSRGDKDFWIVKIDSNGNKQWDKRFGGTGREEFGALQQTADSGYVLAGTSNSNTGGDKTENSKGDNDFWLIKIDANGIKQWDKCFGGAGEDVCNSIQITLDGNYILAGESTSGISGDKTQDSRGFEDDWIIKVNKKGNKLWDKRFGGSGYDGVKSLQQTDDGGYILGGYSDSGISGDKSESNRGDYDYWIVKTDENGEKLWDRTFGGKDYEYFSSISQTIDHGYMLGGASQSGKDGDKTEISRGSSDFWVVKVDDTGQKQWDKRFGGKDYDFLSSLQQTSDGTYILGGYSESGISGDRTENSRGFDDYWIIKLGCPPSAKLGHRGNLDICVKGSVQLVVDAGSGTKFQWLKNGVKIPGATNRTYTATAPGNYRVAVYASRECSQLSNIIVVTNSCGTLSNSIAITPNPSRGIISVTYQSNVTASIQLKVTDKAGKLLFTKTEQAIKGSNTYHLNLSQLISGVYELQVVNAGEQQQQKFAIFK